MTEADDGRGFCQPVSLGHHESQIRPELLKFWVQWCSAHDEATESPSEQPMHLAESPPAHQRRLGASRRVFGLRKAAHNEVSQNFQEFRHGDQRTHAPRPNLSRNFLRIGAVQEYDRCWNQRNQEHCYGLSEKMAHRQQIKDAKWR
jgi:hypothetical protein